MALVTSAKVVLSSKNLINKDKYWYYGFSLL